MNNVYDQGKIPIENYPEGIYVNWRDGFWVAVNYGSNGYELETPIDANFIIGSKVLASGGVSVWMEKQLKREKTNRFDGQTV